MIDKLEFFICLAREQSFSRAAEICGVTQPTLSSGIKNLEDTLGVLLVNRSSRFHGLTPEGERVLQWAKRIVADARSMREEVRGAKKNLSGQLKIAVVPTALGVVQELTAPYHLKHPAVRFTILARTSRQILGMLDALEIDAGVTYLDNEPLGPVRTVPFYLECYKLLIKADHDLAKQGSVTLAQIAKTPLCLLTPDMQNRRIIDRLIAAGHVEPAPMLESDSMTVLVAHVRTGLWASVVADRLADTLGFADSLALLDIIDAPHKQTIGLVLPQRDPMTSLVQELYTEAKRLGLRVYAGAANKP